VERDRLVVLALDVSGRQHPANCERAADFELGSVSRSNVATTSSTVNGVPSCHWTPWRMVKSQVDASAPGAHFVASRGVRT
jgi:hypothetical protein